MAAQSLSDVISLAIQREIEACEFYRSLHATVEDRTARDTLDFLAGQELQHRKFLEDYQAGRLGTGGLRLTQAVDYKIPEHLEKPDISKNMESRDVYLVAAHREQNSVNFYTGLAAMHPDGALRDVLLRMANEEKLHKEKVEYLYSNTAFPQTDGG